MKVPITISLDTARDTDIIDWLEGQENRSEAIRDAIRRGLDTSAGPDDLAAILTRIECKVDAVLAGSVRTGEHGADRPSVEPPDVAATLDRLGV